jgi:hypothetical protein
LPTATDTATDTAIAAPSSRDAATVRPPRAPAVRPARGRWFALGLVTGAVVAVFARGEGPATLHDLREWSARTLRSLEHRPERRPQTESGAAAPVLAQASLVTRPAPTSEAPCSEDPGPGDPCAELLAPFLTKTTASLDVPTYPVESLPRAKPPVVARRHRGRPAPAPAPADDDSEDTARATTPAPNPPHDELVAPERIPIVAPEQTAENELR